MKQLNRLWKWLKTRWKWYVMGYYHCDRCPYSWEEGYEDFDCGCFIKGDIQDTCRLIPPFRGIVGWFKMNAYAYAAEHEYDGLEEWVDKDMACEKAIKAAVRKGLGSYKICRQNTGGYWEPIGDFYTDSVCHTIRNEYDEVAHSVINPPLNERWNELIADTWKHCLIYRLVPYFYRRKNWRKKK